MGNHVSPFYKQVTSLLSSETGKGILYLHMLWQRLATGSKSVNEDPELFDKIFIIGRWDANLTEKKINCDCLMIQLGFCHGSIKFQVDFILHKSSPFAFNTKPFFLFF